MTRDDKGCEGDREIDDHPQRLLIRAYTRLALLPKKADGSKATWIMKVGDCDLRILEMPESDRADIPSLRVELYDREADRTIDSVGCRDLQEAGSATDCLVAAALQRSARKLALRIFDPTTGKFVEVDVTDITPEGP